ncbi:acetyltransferase [Pseudomonas sp. BIGb0164]|jgi:sugar O-acyltransferase (sialic acid O-acetyltransferase NeuD family)|uniref:acetyltransferase n=1 Tax=Pseudomonas sp. BIGb0164 TaxID=2940605 RepID=UPI0021699FEA|nr:acetyltransferase [Pseudomonas sp. BIGb0164]MCS4248635.1 sugar O-acyltransferase (sialic acid O-acetyltransferase NeuD family) [Pseudomonas sp. BIGb0164]
MPPLTGLLILGFGGHARAVADVALAIGIKQLCFIDINARPGETFGTFPVLPSWDKGRLEGWSVMPASGDCVQRHAQCEWAAQLDWPLATLVSPTATLGFGATVGAGSFVGHHAHVGPMASVGQGCVINTGAIVEHECTVGDFTHISIKAAVAGRCQIGKGCFIGAGSTVIDGLIVSDGVTLGAGACAHRNLTEPGVYVGVPAKQIRREGQR